MCHSTYAGVTCERRPGHTGAHRALKGLLYISWTDQDVEDATYKPEITTVPFYGWRCWEVSNRRPPQTPVLSSMAVNYEWTGPVATTVKINGRPQRVLSRQQFDVDYNGGRLGVHAFKKATRMWQQYYGLPVVVGLVELQDHVIEHEYGYRAQIAVIRRLWLTPLVGRRIELLQHFERLYDCTVDLIRGRKLGDYKDDTTVWARKMDTHSKEELWQTLDEK
jgi:hypothetical protein